MKTETLERVGKIAKDIGEVVVFLGGLYLTNKYVMGGFEKTYSIDNKLNCTYDDVIDAIVNSSMFDSAKQKCIKVIKPYGTAAYYKAVISVVNSSMLDSAKIDSITEMSK